MIPSIREPGRAKKNHDSGGSNGYKEEDKVVALERETKTQNSEAREDQDCERKKKKQAHRGTEHNQNK